VSEATEEVTVKPSEIIPCFTISSPAIREVAYKEACKMAPDSEVCSVLLSILKNRQESRQAWLDILKALTIHGKGNAEVQETLRDRLEQSSIELQISIAEAFFLVGGEVNLALEAITPSLQVAYRQTKGYAVSALISFGSSALPVADVIVKIATDEEEFESHRCKALEALRAIGPEAKVVSPQMAKALQTRSAKVLSELLDTLEVIGVVKEAVPNLVAAFNYRDPSTGHIRNRHPGLMFTGCGADMHEVVSKLLGSLGKDAKEVLPNLEELLRRETDLDDWKKRLDEEAEKHNTPILAQFEKDKTDGKKRRRPHAGFSLRRGSEYLRPQDIRLTSLEAKRAALDAIGSIKYGLVGVV
jgi:hypothetical protein